MSGYVADHRLGVKSNNKLKPEENDKTVCAASHFSGECHQDQCEKIVFPTHVDVDTFRSD